MSLCLMAGGERFLLGPAGRFRLEWQHSVEREGWREDWQLTPAGLRLIGAAVKGSGAGMEPGPGGHFDRGWWVWDIDGPVVPELLLAASGATGSGWTLCANRCVTFGTEAGPPIRLAPCPG
jgi:hypothetical protein